MDAGDGRCVLGYVSEKMGGPIKKWESKLFGNPVWQDEDTSPQTPLRCGICSDTMLFVCQLYSPVDGLERSLYAFACPQEACSMRSAGWRVVRNQQASADTTASSSSTATAAAAAAPPVTPPQPSVAVKKLVSDWSMGGVDDDDDDDLSELMGMIAARENKAKNKEKPPAATPVATPAPAAALLPAPPARDAAAPAPRVQVPVCLSAAPEWRLWDDSVEGGEPSVPASVLAAAPSAGGPGAAQQQQQAGDSEGAYIRGEDDDDDDDDDDDSTGAGRSGAGDARVLALLDSYAEDPENAALVAELKAGLGKKKAQPQAQPPAQGQARSGGSVRGRRPEPDAAYMYPTAGIVSSPGGGATSAAGTASRQLQSYRLKIEGYFHRRTAFHPQQVLRYGYGLQPLWCSVLFRDMFPPSPSGSGSSSGKKREGSGSSGGSGNPALSTMSQLVPCCRGCGAARVFEFQLMPALLSRYSSVRSSVVAHAVAAADQSQANSAGSAGIGMEFGVVCVFVCPNSCSGAGNGTGDSWEECAIVQPPADMIAN